MVACSFDLVCNAAASPDKSALPGTSSNVHRGNRLVDVDVARPITPENEGVQQLPQPIRASGAASADSFAAKNRGHCRRSGEQLLAVACGAAFGVQHRTLGSPLEATWQQEMPMSPAVVLPLLWH